jgi:hypothetical protein
MPQNLTTDLITLEPFATPEAGGRLLELVKDHAPAAMPGPWGHHEPFTHRWETGAEQEAFARDRVPGEFNVHFESQTRGAAHMGVYSPLGPRESRGLVHLVADDEVVEPLAVVGLVKAAAHPFGVDYGHVHLLTEADARRRPRPDRGYVGWSDTAGEYTLMVIEQRLRSNLLELWWGTVFGPEYTRLLGTEPFETAPAYLVERLGDETFWVQLTEDARDNVVFPEQVEEARRKVKAHLGKDLFWSPERTNYRAPAFAKPVASA